MLNNDFKELVNKYARYKNQQKRTRNRKILFVGLAAALAYFLSTLNMKNILPDTTKEQNLSVKNVPEHNTTIPIKPLVSHPVVTPKEENLSEIITPRKPKKVKQKVHKPVVQKPKFHVTTRKKSLEELLENQASSQSYSSTIALANFHFSKKAYQEAIKWAISASKKNKANPRPWIVYAKSKKALGKKHIAQKALKLFLKKHPDEEVQNLLNSL